MSDDIDEPQWDPERGAEEDERERLRLDELARRVASERELPKASEVPVAQRAKEREVALETPAPKRAKEAPAVVSREYERDEEDFVDEGLTAEPRRICAEPMFVPAQTARRRAAVGEALQLHPPEITPDYRLEPSVDWRDNYVRERWRLERGGELVPLATLVERMRQQLPKFIAANRWDASPLHKNECPSRMASVLLADTPDESLGPILLEMLNRIEARSVPMNDVSFEPKLTYAVTDATIAALKLSSRPPEELRAYEPDLEEPLRFLLPFAPEVELDKLSSFESNPMWQQQEEGAGPLDEHHYALLSFETLSSICEGYNVMEPLTDLWTGPAVSLLAGANKPVFFWKRQIEELTGMSTQQLDKVQLRRALVFIAQVHAIQLPALQHLLASSTTQTPAEVLFVPQKAGDGRNCFASDDAYTLFVYQHLCVLNAALARLLCTEYLASLVPPLAQNRGIPAGSPDHISRFVVNYAHFRYVYAHRIFTCASAFMDYSFNPTMRWALYSPMAILSKGNVVFHHQRGKQKNKRIEVFARGEMRFNALLLTEIRSLLLDPTLDQTSSLTPMHLYALAKLRAYHVQNECMGVDKSKIVCLDTIPVGMLADAIFSREQDGKRKANKRKPGDIFAWLHQPLEFYCRLQSDYHRHISTSLNATRVTPPWKIYNSMLHKEVMRAMTRAVAGGGSATPNESETRVKVPLSNKVVVDRSELSMISALLAWFDDNIETLECVSTAAQEGSFDKKTILPVFTSFYNERSTHRDLSLTNYGLRKLSIMIHNARPEVNKLARYRIKPGSALERWLGTRRPSDIIKQLKESCAEKRKRSAEDEDEDDEEERERQEELRHAENRAKAMTSEAVKLASKANRQIYMRQYMRARREEKAADQGRELRRYRMTKEEREERKRNNAKKRKASVPKEETKAKKAPTEEEKEKERKANERRELDELFAGHPDARV